MCMAMENCKNVIEMNENIIGVSSVNKTIVNDKVEQIRVHCGASDSYFEDM